MNLKRTFYQHTVMLIVTFVGSIQTLCHLLKCCRAGTAGQFGKQGENYMQGHGEGLVTAVCVFLFFPLLSLLDWVGGWLIVQKITIAAMTLVTWLLQSKRRNMMTY